MNNLHKIRAEENIFIKSLLWYITTQVYVPGDFATVVYLPTSVNHWDENGELVSAYSEKNKEAFRYISDLWIEKGQPKYIDMRVRKG